MYLITQDQHAQIVEALDAAENYMTSLRKPLVLSTLVMVEGLEPMKPVAYANFAENGNIRIWKKFDTASAEEVRTMKPLYTTENTK